MKTSITSSKISFLFLAALAPGLCFAKLAGKVHELKGQAFLVREGKTEALRKDMDLLEGSQIMVADDSHVTLGDFHDRYYHLMPGTLFTLREKASVLQRGGVWSQARVTRTAANLSTANMLVRSLRGEFVLTYDSASQHSQLSVVTGEVDVASPADPALRYGLAAGQFTVARPEVDDGYPRTPAKLGYESLLKVVGQFPTVRSWDAGVARAQETQASSPARGIASVSEAAPQGQIIFMKTTLSAQDRVPASWSGEAQKYFQLKKATRPSKAESAKVRVIGFQADGATASRNPASPVVMPSKDKEHRSKSSDFLESYQLHLQKQPVHSKEVQRLIDDLKSY